MVPSVMTRPGLYGTPGGYYRYIFTHPRTSRSNWVHKKLSSRFWDAKVCRYKGPGSFHRHESYKYTPWFVTPFFVSVSIPLVDRETRDIDGAD